MQAKGDRFSDYEETEEEGDLPRKKRRIQVARRMPRRRYGSGCEEDCGNESDDYGDEGDEGDDDNCNGKNYTFMKGNRHKDKLNIKKMFKTNLNCLKGTKEYIEKTYYEDKKSQKNENIVRSSKFWIDAVEFLIGNANAMGQSDSAPKFLTFNFVYCLSSLTERILAVSL